MAKEPNTEEEAKRQPLAKRSQRKRLTPSTPHQTDRIDTLTTQLVKRYIDLVVLASVSASIFPVLSVPGFCFSFLCFNWPLVIFAGEARERGKLEGSWAWVWVWVIVSLV